ncbi:MAG TPA: hypothetical protein GXX48_05045 [Ochrobactrum intermedium]|uniref:Major tropism determinant N-terminal domain-containing protein n=1 Tax=Brucella intermedia TaxID=94625 RepID=A0A7V6TYJ8_9HYPH|nr:hypothetical protein [Brucella intermedia]HHV66996.1 hypothetical protein [Brucella intermedia]
MATEVRWRRGTAAEHEDFTGAMSEITHDTTNNNLRVHDGQKPGGYATLMEDQLGVAGGVAALDETGNVPEEQLGNASIPTVANYAELKSTPVAEKEKVAFLTLAGSEGTFFWKLGDFSQKIDDENYVASDHHPATVGAWVRSSIHAPYVLPTFRGLKISEFLTSNDAWETDKSTSLQNAVYALLGNDRYHGLDLEGRLLTIGVPINFGTENAYFPNKYIANGHIYALEEFPDGEYLFDLKDNPDLRNFKFLNVSMMGDNRAGWLRMPEKYKYVTLESCFLLNAGGLASEAVLSGMRVGIYDPDTPSGGSHELGVYSCFLDSGQYENGKNQVAIYSNNPDINISNNLCQYFKAFFIGSSGSYQINGNHVWSNTDNGLPCIMAKFLNATYGLGLQFNNNYVDGVQVILSNENNPSQHISGAAIIGNNFLLTPDAPNGMPFVLIQPHQSNSWLSGLDMSGNTYDTNSTSSHFVNIAVDETYGNIDPDHITSVVIADNAFNEASQWGKIYQSKARYNSSLVASDNGYKYLNFADAIPPFSKVKQVRSAQFSRLASDGGLYFAVPNIDGDSAVGVVITNGSSVMPAEGRIFVEVDINSDKMN